MSSMQFMGGYDMDVYERYTPWFIGAYDGTNLIGCNGGHQSSNDMYRSRGLYVKPDYRKNGIGKQLLLGTISFARTETQCNYIWSIPRHGSHWTYLSVGFSLASPWFNDKVEFGPNCYVNMKL
jgi:GNAT superfamily N-acetyltransferase